MGVGPLGRRRVVGRRKIVVDSPRELHETHGTGIDDGGRGEAGPQEAALAAGDELGLMRARFHPPLLLCRSGGYLRA